MRALRTIKKIVDRVMACINIALLACMTVLVTYQVIARFFFNSPSAVAETLAQYMFVWVIMFGSAYTFGKREHLEISIVKNKLSPLPRLIDDYAITVVLIIFSLAVMGIGGWALTRQQMGSVDAALQIPMGVIYASIPICAVVILIYSVYLFAEDYQKYKVNRNKGGALV